MLCSSTKLLDYMVNQAVPMQAWMPATHNPNSSPAWGHGTAIMGCVGDHRNIKDLHSNQSEECVYESQGIYKFEPKCGHHCLVGKYNPASTDHLKQPNLAVSKLVASC